MESPLSFGATEKFRKSLLLRNLPPYEDIKYDGLPGDSEFNIDNYSVIDPGNVEEIGDKAERKLYVKNKYGPENQSDYGDTKDVNIVLQTESNNGEYEYLTSEPSISNEDSQKRLFVLNWYGPQEGFGEFGPVNIENVERFIENRNLYYTFIA